MFYLLCGVLFLILVVLLAILLAIRLDRRLENDTTINNYYANKTYDHPIGLRPSNWGGHGIDSSGHYWQLPPGYQFKRRR